MALRRRALPGGDDHEAFAGPVTLQNCDREPIHTPGAIQAHGVLVSMDVQGQVLHVSTNVGEMWAVPPQPGEAWATVLPRLLPSHAALQAHLSRVPEASALPLHEVCEMDGQVVDVIWSAHPQGLMLELETRPGMSLEAVTRQVDAIHALAGRLVRAPDLDRMLNWAVQGLRRVTGFDRVMAYRFRHDDSGEVVAEDCSASLDPFLGRVYPASDIPAQARRLYILKMLRGIADVHQAPVSLLAAPDSSPLDMSQGELRSVSPIHIEYLQNMGVGASLSVSIVVQGRLWGLLACHHMGPLRLAYPVRLALEVLAHLVGARVDTWQRERIQQRESALAAQRARLSLELARREDTLAVLCEQAAQWLDTWSAHGWMVVLDDAVQASDAALSAHWPAMSAWMSQQPAQLVAQHDSALWPSEGSGMAGLMALRFSDVQQAWVMLFRREQVQTLRWGGKPEKLVKIGPMGPRLTPRGSFEEWREEVKGTAVPWGSDDLALAESVRQSLHRVYAELMLERRG